MENGDIEVGEFWVGTSLPESLEVEHSFISSFYRQLLDRSDHLPYVVAPLQKLRIERRKEGVLHLQNCRGEKAKSTQDTPLPTTSNRRLEEGDHIDMGAHTISGDVRV